jgi:hypothetical protein
LDRHPDGYLAHIDAALQQQLAMLRILYGACSTAVDVLRAADDPMDAAFLSDLGRMVERTRQEIERLAPA